MIDNRIVRVNTPSIVESRTEVVTKSGTRSYSIAMMAARIAVGIAACKIPIFFSSSPNGKRNAKPMQAMGPVATSVHMLSRCLRSILISGR